MRQLLTPLTITSETLPTGSFFNGARAHCWPSLVLIMVVICLGCTRPETRVDREGQEELNATTIETEAVVLNYPEDTAPPPFRLGPGDQIEIEVLDQEGTRTISTIGIDGYIYIGPLPEIRAAGMTLDELHKEISLLYSTYYKNATVLVNALEIVSNRATILGRVNKPGIIRLQGTERVLDLLTDAGGLSVSRFSGSTEELADLDAVIYIRDNQFIPIDFLTLVHKGDTRYNIRVHAGDYCYIPSSYNRLVTVLGAVKKPNGIAFKPKMTLLQAIGRAEGFDEDAYLDEVLIIRGSTAHPQAVKIDTRRIFEGKEPDIFLEPRDIVFVPGRDSDSLGRYKDIAIDASAVGFGAAFAAHVFSKVKSDDG